uniref:Kynurenine 3-monooxygenase n=1 Tax=Acrobeloides nanus TaxID=290746 RepID=A0A914DQW9_9BILA
MPKVAIAGAGLVGALNACFFAQKGWDVEVYEFRPDIRQMEHVPGRSINLALSFRGKSALEAVGLKDYIVNQGVELSARLIHDIDGETLHRQPYGQPGEHIVSINRRHLNEVMITEAEKFGNHKFNGVKFFFQHKVIKVDSRKGILLVNRIKEGDQVEVEADLILACDGAHSAVRRSLMTFPLFQFSQEYIAHGYVELNILPKNDKFALEPNVFHLWPRGDFTLIALANIDKTFTVTIFAPFELFEKEMSTEQKVVSFFKCNFPDAFELLGERHIVETFNRVRPLPLVSIKCEPHAFHGKVLLMGDAAHAMVPFYGQGMNAGFEDCLVLSELLDKFNDNIPTTLDYYSKTRCKDAHAINDLAMYNYNELKDLVNKTLYKIRKTFDLSMNRYFPKFWIPLYSMVTFTRIPYHQVILRRKWQDKVLRRTIYSTVLIVFSLFGAAVWKRHHQSIVQVLLAGLRRLEQRRF